MTREIDLDALADEVRRDEGGRSLTAIAGSPGSGKSTVAEELVEKLNAAEPGAAAVLPMDGYHLDDMLLNERGWRARKGAPHTFDVAGFAHMLRRIRANTDAEILVPVFDRSIEIARRAARAIPQSARHIIVEGNYLLLEAPGWTELRQYFDRTVFLDVPEPELRARLKERWKALDEAALAEKLEGNDLPNMRLVLSNRVAPDFILRNI